MKRDLEKRLEALEREATERCVLWIGPPEGALAGWEVVPMAKGGAAHVWRDGGESDEDLQARAALEANRHQGVVVVFGMDANGVTR
ncbi:hypothetical protein [Halomonas ventosae]|uniref:Uncharacterized protein n=1 Tax=Halomonas ventosae TaxID=229007 RepID=A0A4R6HZB6_9GAMM|nr:hypothetical protein [Halomonas ventosae]TDO13785.1 hypothetical protein DFO68_1036 [Halomonas ventosae]